MDNEVVPPPCQDDVFKNGTIICILPSVNKTICEAWVLKIAKESGQQVDWHFWGGRNIVKALGNLKKVTQVVKQFKDEIIPHCGSTQPTFWEFV